MKRLILVLILLIILLYKLYINIEGFNKPKYIPKLPAHVIKSFIIPKPPPKPPHVIKSFIIPKPPPKPKPPPPVQISSFVYYNNEIPNEIHELFKNNKNNTFKYKEIKEYFKYHDNMKTISPDYECHYTYEDAQKEYVFDYDLDDPYNNIGKLFNYSKYDTDWLLSPYNKAYGYCIYNDNGYPSCSMLSCNMFNLETHRYKMFDYINSDRLKKKNENSILLKNNRINNESSLKNDIKDNLSYIDTLKNNIILL